MIYQIQKIHIVNSKNVQIQWGGAYPTYEKAAEVAKSLKATFPDMLFYIVCQEDKPMEI